MWREGGREGGWGRDVDAPVQPHLVFPDVSANRVCKDGMGGFEKKE